MKSIVKGILQIAFFILVSFVMNVITDFFHLKIPGSILGIILIFILLKTKVIKLNWVETGANWLLAELLLFFIPSAVGIIQYKDLLYKNGIQVVIVVILSTGLVMTCAGLVAVQLAKRKERKKAL
ncbi:holin-like protein [Pullulanibacillus pueri]|uniref:Holin-like protein CidA n=1 Tax=Pullulanibacillus pueri TaxID=1437324 RepID=A0A8J3ELG2_9BACL|nr:CidA/LrgA family holin-like protein [Pullulanibacillus pueri]MBM7680798.1 holin-like protein [Pullulanibacillus pueri]GGH78375.1 holin-like protein CidA [Pullulanibacillus pueri]